MDGTLNSMFNKSLAFLEVAIISSKENQSTMYNTSEYSNVTGHLYIHSLELFLKFSIYAHEKKYPFGHDLNVLYEKYKNIYPDKKFDIEIPFNNIEYSGFTDEEIEKHNSEYPLDIKLQLRYPIGDKGESYSPITKFETEYLEHMKEEFTRIMSLIIWGE